VPPREDCPTEFFPKFASGSEAPTRSVVKERSANRYAAVPVTIPLPGLFGARLKEPQLALARHFVGMTLSCPRKRLNVTPYASPSATSSKPVSAGSARVPCPWNCPVTNPFTGYFQPANCYQSFHRHLFQVDIAAPLVVRQKSQSLSCIRPSISASITPRRARPLLITSWFGEYVSSPSSESRRNILITHVFPTEVALKLRPRAGPGDFPDPLQRPANPHRCFRRIGLSPAIAWDEIVPRVQRAHIQPHIKRRILRMQHAGNRAAEVGVSNSNCSRSRMSGS